MHVVFFFYSIHQFKCYSVLCHILCNLKAAIYIDVDIGTPFSYQKPSGFFLKKRLFKSYTFHNYDPKKVIGFPGALNSLPAFHTCVIFSGLARI
jgi:hypothetical protein